MKLLRILLFPFAVLYGIITGIRNFIYDKGILKSYSFPAPVIAVGNLSTGGTGKSPQTEYLIRLLSDKYKVATLSRGYKRKSKGFVLADKSSNADTLGDEPFQFFTKFPNIRVAVDANRKNGIEQLLSLHPKPEVIILDDAYQHRKVKAGFYILLTAYDDLYSDDFILPTGNLRESRSGAKRADVIIVTKCPPGLSIGERDTIRKKLRPLGHQEIYFTFIEYDEFLYSEHEKINAGDVSVNDAVLVAGIAKPEHFFNYLGSDKDHRITFPDHHNFTEADIADITKRADGKIVITTEKDYMRLKGKMPPDKLYYLPIKSTFINSGADFNKTILNYVGKSTGDSSIS
jgi:tetraacyldisaccharide 4'-kinase